MFKRDRLKRFKDRLAAFAKGLRVRPLRPLPGICTKTYCEKRVRLTSRLVCMNGLIRESFSRRSSLAPC